MRFFQAKQRQRQPVLVIQISFGFQDPQLRAQQGRQNFFRGGLADGACDPGDFPAPCFAHSPRQLLECLESVGHGDTAVAHPVRKARELCFRHHGRHSSKLQRTGHMIVSVVTRSVDGHEQFSGTYRARINRHTGQPGHGVESRPRPSTQSASHLCNRPPHKLLKGLVLVQYPKARSFSNVLRAPPLERPTFGSPQPARGPALVTATKQAR